MRFGQVHICSNEFYFIRLGPICLPYIRGDLRLGGESARLVVLSLQSRQSSTSGRWDSWASAISAPVVRNS